MNINNLKMKDLAEVEVLSGYNMDEWETCPKVKLTMAIAYVVAKKQRPDITMEEIENMGIEEMNALAGGEDPKAKAS